MLKIKGVTKSYCGFEINFLDGSSCFYSMTDEVASELFNCYKKVLLDKCKTKDDMHLLVYEFAAKRMREKHREYVQKLEQQLSEYAKKMEPPLEEKGSESVESCTGSAS